MVQHDMMMLDHGMLGPDGNLNPEPRREADVNIEFQENSRMAAASHKLASLFKNANAGMPPTIRPPLDPTCRARTRCRSRTSSRRSHCARTSGAITSASAGIRWHQPTDVFSTFTDKDCRLGLNAAQTTLAAIAQLAGAKIKAQR
jgi:hypothetical protein